jgi:hypothetical protein
MDMSDSDDESRSYIATPEHEWLASQTGLWSVRCEYFMGSPDDPIEVEGTEEVSTVAPFWIISRFTADLLGTPMVGQAATGFNPVTRKFIGTWQDSSIPFLYVFEGKMESGDDGVKTIRFEGENFDPVRRRKALYRSSIRYPSANEKILDLSVESDETKIPILRYNYTRTR